MIAQLPYIKVIRSIEENQQHYKEEEYMIAFSVEAVWTDGEVFHQHEVLDMSFRPFSNQMGLIYLHTIKGLYCYTIKENPKMFIETFKLLKSAQL